MFRGFVVDDNTDATAILMEALAELAAVTIVGSADGEAAAIAWLTDPVNEWNMAIVDLQLGANGSGYRVLSALAARQPNQRVVVWTGGADALARTRCRVLGCDRIFDRATEVADMLDYCMVESEATAIRSPASRVASGAAATRPVSTKRFGVTSNLAAQVA